MKKKEIKVKEIRKFAVTMFIALGVLGGLLLWRKGEIGIIFCAISAIFLALGLSYPKVLYPIYRAWMAMASMIGFVMTHLVLTVIYYILFVPLGLLMRAFNKTPLALNLEPDSQTYWLPRGKAEASIDRYEKMF